MKITRKQILPVISAARELKAARAEHKKKIEYVSKIQARVLGEIPLYTDRLLDRKDCRKDNLRRITDVEEMYLSKDEEACQRVYDALHEQYAADGHKLSEVGYCPALVAGDKVRQLEQKLIETMTPVTKVSHHQLCCSGMDKYHQYVALLEKLAEVNEANVKDCEIEQTKTNK